MSGDHNINQTSAAWRKRQIALDKKAENARELGLDYEPDKTVIEMAYEAGMFVSDDRFMVIVNKESLERFAELVRADEREACAKVCEDYGRAEEMQAIGNDYAEAIRARGNSK